MEEKYYVIKIVKNTQGQYAPIEGLTYLAHEGSGWTYLGNNKWSYDGSLSPGEKANLIVKFNITKVVYLTNIANVTVNNGTEIYPNASINVTEQKAYNWNSCPC